MCSTHVAISDIGAARGIGLNHVVLLHDQGALAGDIEGEQWGQLRAWTSNEVEYHCDVATHCPLLNKM